MKKLVPLLLLPLLGGCAFARADMANKTKQTMVGLAKSDLLACMGVPSSTAKIDDTEAWKFNSGGSVVGSSSSYGSASGSVIGNMVTAYGSSNTFSSAEARYCVINVVLKNDRVISVNYTGPTGGLLTQGSECAYAVSSCARPEHKTF